MDTQRRRSMGASSCNGFILGALCFMAVLPFLYLQQDGYEQRRFLASTTYNYKPQKRRKRRKRALKEYGNGHVNDDSHHLHNEATIKPPPQDERDCLVVFHLPKTGGSSLLYALRFLALERKWDFYDYHGEQLRITGDANGEPTKPIHRAIHYGHFYSTFLERSGTSQCLRMTLLRDPIDRVISHFYYWGGKENQWPRVSDIAQDCQGNPFLQRNSNQFSNLMTRMLMMDGVNNRTVFPPHLWHIFQTESSRCQYAYPLDEQAATQSAIEHLKKMDLVCFMDDLEGCLQQARTLLRLPPGGEIKVPHMNSVNANAAASGGNVKVKPHDLAMKNDTIRTLVASVNLADIALYDWALQNVKTK